MRIELTPAYILHQRAYRDTSLIIDFFSREYGLISALAKGAKRPRSPFRTALQSFTPLYASWVGNREMVTLTKLEVDHFNPRLMGNRLVAGFYLNEILLRLLSKGESHETIFDIYAIALQGLQQNEIENSLRQFELALLKELGYGLLLEHDADTGEQVDPQSSYLYVFEHGPVKVSSARLSAQEGLLIKGESLIALATDNLVTDDQRKQVRMLIRQALRPLLGSKPLQSRELWQRVALPST